MGLIIASKNDKKQLDEFLSKINTNVPHKIYVIEQDWFHDFNCLKLFNVGFEIAKHKHDYFAFHDVHVTISSVIDYSYPSEILIRPDVILSSKEDVFKIDGFCHVNYDIIHIQNKKNCDIYSVRI